jgi:hypothetical protein
MNKQKRPTAITVWGVCFSQEEAAHFRFFIESLFERIGLSPVKRQVADLDQRFLYAPRKRSPLDLLAAKDEPLTEQQGEYKRTGAAAPEESTRSTTLRSQDSDGCCDSIGADNILATQSGQAKVRNGGEPFDQLYVEAMSIGTRVERSVPEVDPGACDGIPRLEGALLRAEQQAVPGGAIRAGRAYPRDLLGKCDGLEDSVREGLAGFGVDAKCQEIVRPGDSGGSIEITVGDTANDSRRPERLPIWSRQEGRFRNSELGKRCAGTGSSSGEFLAAFGSCGHHDFCFGRKQRTAMRTDFFDRKNTGG